MTQTFADVRKAAAPGSSGTTSGQPLIESDRVEGTEV